MLETLSQRQFADLSQFLSDAKWLERLEWRDYIVGLHCWLTAAKTLKKAKLDNFLPPEAKKKKKMFDEADAKNLLQRMHLKKMTERAN